MAFGHWHNCGSDGWQDRADRWRDHMREHAERKAERWQRRAERWQRRHAARYGSGNSAFDEYRAETLRRLEEEQEEFIQFLERLRMAKDKAEFDEFLAERRRRASETPPEEHPPA